MEKKKNILVVEDFNSIRSLLSDTLQYSGFNTLSAANGEEALKVLADNAVDLVLTDLHMPVMNGLQLLEAMKKNTLTATVPVVILTSEPDPLLRRRAKELGLSAWIKKPYMRAGLLANIENILNNGRIPERTAVH